MFQVITLWATVVDKEAFITEVCAGKKHVYCCLRIKGSDAFFFKITDRVKF